MIKSKIIESLKTLSKKEFLEFDKFVKSPFFIKRSDATVLFSRIKKYYPDFMNKDFTKEKIFREAFQKKKYSDVLMRKYLSELYRMFLEFLAFKNFKNDHVSFSKHLLNELFTLGSYSEADKQLNEIMKRLESSGIRNENYYYEKFHFEKTRNVINRSKEIVPSRSNIQPETNSLTNYAMLAIIRQYSIMLNDSRFDKTNYDFSLMNSFMQLIETGKFKSDAVTNIYYLVIKSILEPSDTELYRRLKKELEKNTALFEYDEMSSLYVYLHNYCFMQIEKGRYEFLRERFNINKVFLERRYAFRKGFIMPVVFDSVVITALQVGEAKWAYKFIGEYNSYIDIKYRESTVNFNLSVYYFFTKDYDEAIENLSKVNLTEYYDKIKTKALYLMIYYENRMFDSALSLIDTFKHFIFKNKAVPEYVRDRTNNFLLVVIHLIRYRLGEIRQIDDELRNKNSILNRIWIQQKIKELEEETAGNFLCRGGKNGSVMVTLII